MKIRGFELVSSFTDENLLPKRETAHGWLRSKRLQNVRLLLRRDRPRSNGG